MLDELGNQKLGRALILQQTRGERMAQQLAQSSPARWSAGAREHSNEKADLNVRWDLGVRAPLVRIEKQKKTEGSALHEVLRLMN